MDVVIGTDDNYVPYAGIMLTSLFENNKDLAAEIGIRINILTGGLKLENEAKLKHLGEIYNSEIVIHNVDDTRLGKCKMPEGTHVTRSAYNRILIPDILPKEVSKAIYLDCDMIVCNSLNNLWNTDIRDYAAAVVHDISHTAKEAIERLGYNPSFGYFNSGMMLINLTYWRDNNLVNKIFDCVANLPFKRKYVDQDALNYILCGKVRFLPRIYNFVTANLRWYTLLTADVDKIYEDLRGAVVLHYVSLVKPWHRFNLSFTLSEVYFGYKNISLWRNKSEKFKLKPAYYELFGVSAIKIILLLRLRSLVPSKYQSHIDAYIETKEASKLILSRINRVKV